jgi:hypothetical protein
VLAPGFRDLDGGQRQLGHHSRPMRVANVRNVRNVRTVPHRVGIRFDLTQLMAAARARGTGGRTRRGSTTPRRRPIRRLTAAQRGRTTGRRSPAAGACIEDHAEQRLSGLAARSAQRGLCGRGRPSPSRSRLHQSAAAGTAAGEPQRQEPTRRAQQQQQAARLQGRRARDDTTAAGLFSLTSA